MLIVRLREKKRRNCFLLHEGNQQQEDLMFIFSIFGFFFYLNHNVWYCNFFSNSGNLPNASEGIVERTACFLGNQAGNYCVHHLQIRVKDCGSYRVYYLYPTPSNDEAYCFGKQCIMYPTMYISQSLTISSRQPDLYFHRLVRFFSMQFFRIRSRFS